MYFSHTHKSILRLIYIMNSKSEIIDELNLIKNNFYVKPKTIDDIIEKNVQNIENVIDSYVINIYARPWNKLEPKLKLNRIKKYFNSEQNNFSMETQVLILKFINNKKKVVIKYNIESNIIEDVKFNN